MAAGNQICDRGKYPSTLTAQSLTPSLLAACKALARGEHCAQACSGGANESCEFKVALVARKQLRPPVLALALLLTWTSAGPCPDTTTGAKTASNAPSRCSACNSPRGRSEKAKPKGKSPQGNSSRVAVTMPTQQRSVDEGSCAHQASTSLRTCGSMMAGSDTSA